VAIEYLRERFVGRLRPGDDATLLEILRVLVAGPDT
jgi:hypothetical protein